MVQRSRSGQPRHAAPKVTVRRRVIRRVVPFEQVGVAASVSTVKSSSVNPPARGRLAWPRLDQRDVPGLGDRRQDLPGAVGTVSQHLRGRGDGVVRLQQLDAYRSVSGLRAGGFGQCAPGDDAGVEFGHLVDCEPS